MKQAGVLSSPYTSMSNALFSLFLKTVFWPWNRLGYEFSIRQVSFIKYRCFSYIYTSKIWDYMGKFYCEGKMTTNPFWLKCAYDVTCACTKSSIRVEYVVISFAIILRTTNKSFIRILRLNTPLTCQYQIYPQTFLSILGSHATFHYKIKFAVTQTRL